MLALGLKRIREFDWSMKAYAKQRRSQGPDYDGLKLFAELLKILLNLAPNGIPNYTCLKSGVKLLDEEAKLRTVKDDPVVFAADAASGFRLMLAHLCEMKSKVRKQPLENVIQELVDKIDLEAVPADEPAPQEIEGILLSDADDGDCEMDDEDDDGDDGAPGATMMDSWPDLAINIYFVCYCFGFTLVPPTPTTARHQPTPHAHAKTPAPHRPTQISLHKDGLATIVKTVSRHMRTSCGLSLQPKCSPSIPQHHQHRPPWQRKCGVALDQVVERWRAMTVIVLR